MIGQSLAHYRIEALLGRGGMGEVYRARDTRLDRPVAIKVLTGEGSAGTGGVERFLREARAASSLNHPNIVTVHEAGQAESGAYYIVQELVEGETLRALLRPKLAQDQALGLAIQLARALAAAHGAGIAHRDIKPENLMVRPDGYLKVLDFGLARLTAGDPDASTTTATGTAAGLVLGTIAYMAPEQASGRPSGPPADVFSTGVVLYEMLLGRRPFGGDTALAILHALTTEHPVPPSRLDPDIPPALDALLLAMLDKTPEQRPSIELVLGELEAEPARGRVAGIAAPPRQNLMVGRDAERETLLAIVDEVAGGRGAMMAVTGEPGIGKTTLVEDTVYEISRGPHRPTVARGRCSERLAGTEALLPIFEALDQLLHRQTVGSFGEAMRRLAPTWYVRVAPLAAEGLPPAVRDEVQAASPERMKRELATFLQEISRVKPVVLFFEDVHWADLSTTDILGYLADRFDQLRVLVIVTYRPSDMAAARHPFLQVQRHLMGRHACRELPLQFLGVDDIRRYLTLRFPGHALPDAFAELLHEKTEGSPLFMVDLVRYLVDRGVVAERDGRWVLARAAPDVARDIPQTVKSTISRKLEQLDELDRKLLTVASVQGHEFDSLVLSDVLELDAAETEERLAAIAAIYDLIRSVGTREYPDRQLTVRCRFVHVLYQNVLFAELQPTRRASLSLKVARALVAHHGEAASTIAGELAALFETGRDFAQAARFYQLAVERALPLFAYREAVLLARRGLEMTAALPPGPARSQQELALQVLLGLSLRTVEGWAVPEVEGVYARARALCHELGDVPALFPVLWGTTLYHAIRGDLAIFEELAAELLEQATATNRREHLLGAQLMVACVSEFLGRTAVSSEYFERAVALHDPADHQALTAMFGVDPGLFARSLSVRPLWFLGQADRALARAEETVRLAREQRQVISVVFALCLAQHLHVLRREPAPAIALGDEQIGVCREFGLAQEIEWGRCFQAAGYTLAGRVDEAVAQLRDALAREEAISAGLLRPMFLLYLAEALLAAGELDEGLERIEAGLAWADRSREQFFRAELLRVRGELQIAAGDRAAGEASLRAALEWAARQQALGFELRAATGLCRLLAAEGHGEEGRGLLAAVYDRLTEGFDTADLRDARQLLGAAVTG